MQLRNIRPFSQHNPGDVVDVPDGAAFDPFHYEAVAPAESPDEAAPAAAAASVPRLPYPATAKEM